jgi:hypothetical protein
MIIDVDEMLSIDFESAYQTTIADIQNQSFVRRFIGQAAKLLSPVL